MQSFVRCIWNSGEASCLSLIGLFRAQSALSIHIPSYEVPFSPEGRRNHALPKTDVEAKTRILQSTTETTALLSSYKGTQFAFHFFLLGMPVPTVPRKFIVAAPGVKILKPEIESLASRYARIPSPKPPPSPQYQISQYRAVVWQGVFITRGVWGGLLRGH